MYSHTDHTNSEARWLLFLSGDSQALDTLVKDHYNLLYQYGCKFTRDTGLVKDCIQDLFLFLWQKRTSIRETPSVCHYLMKALRRRLERALTRTKLFVTPGTDYIAFRAIPEESLEDKIIVDEQSAELAYKIRKGLAALSQRQQEILYLRYYLNADPAQIADIMGLHRQSVYNLLHTAIHQLRIISETYFKPVLSAIILLIACSATPTL